MFRLCARTAEWPFFGLMLLEHWSPGTCTASIRDFLRQAVLLCLPMTGLLRVLVAPQWATCQRHGAVYRSALDLQAQVEKILLRLALRGGSVYFSTSRSAVQRPHHARNRTTHREDLRPGTGDPVRQPGTGIRVFPSPGPEPTLFRRDPGFPGPRHSPEEHTLNHAPPRDHSLWSPRSYHPSAGPAPWGLPVKRRRSSWVAFFIRHR